MKSLISVLLILFAAFSTATHAYKEVTYDGNTKLLTVPTIKLGDRWYHNIVVRIDSSEIVSYSATSSSTGPQVCTASLTQSQLDAIQIGMTLDQINSLLGCRHLPLYSGEPITIGAPDPTILSVNWLGSNASSITVFFDRGGKVVTPINGSNGPVFKSGFFMLTGY